jgi:hypothetical protein
MQPHRAATPGWASDVRTVRVDWLLDYLEDRHARAEVDAADEGFVEPLRARLGRR